MTEDYEWTDLDTNQKISTLMRQQTYDERIEFASYLSEAAIDWAKGDSGIDGIDSDYFATLLGSFADSQLGDETA